MSELWTLIGWDWALSLWQGCIQTSWFSFLITYSLFFQLKSPLVHIVPPRKWLRASFTTGFANFGLVQSVILAKHWWGEVVNNFGSFWRRRVDGNPCNWRGGIRGISAWACWVIQCVRGSLAETGPGYAALGCGFPLQKFYCCFQVFKCIYSCRSSKKTELFSFGLSVIWGNNQRFHN